MVLISYSVINIIYRRYCWNGFQRKLCLFGSCLTAFRRLSGLTRRRNEKHTIGIALEKGLGSDRLYEWSLRNGKEGNYRSPCGAEVYDWDEVQYSIRGQREERTQLLEQNEAKMEIIYCKHMDKSTRYVFYFLHSYWVVGLLRFFIADTAKQLTD